MALSQNTYVHMETMEETQDEGTKFNKNGSTKRVSMASWQQPSRLLVYNTNSCCKYGNDKKRLIRSGFYDLAIAYQSVHVNY